MTWSHGQRTYIRRQLDLLGEGHATHRVHHSQAISRLAKVPLFSLRESSGDSRCSLGGFV